MIGRNYREKVRLAHASSRTRNSFRFENPDVAAEWDKLVTFVRITGELTIAFNDVEYTVPTVFAGDRLVANFIANETMIIRSCAVRVSDGRSIHSDWSGKGGVSLLAGDSIAITLPGPKAQPEADANSPNFGKIQIRKKPTVNDWLK